MTRRELDDIAEEKIREHFQGCKTCKSHYKNQGFDEDDFVLEALETMDTYGYLESIKDIQRVHEWANRMPNGVIK